MSQAAEKALVPSSREATWLALRVGVTTTRRRRRVSAITLAAANIVRLPSPGGSLDDEQLGVAVDGGEGGELSVVEPLPADRPPG